MTKKTIPWIIVALIVTGSLIGSNTNHILDSSSTTEEDRMDRTISMAQTSHEPIEIDGNVALDIFCGGNGTDGLTWETAYQITNFSITEGIKHGIFIQNTDKFLILSHIVIQGFAEWDGGIKIQNCSNIVIQNCTLLENFYGIYLEASTNVTITENDFLTNMYSIKLRNSHNNSIFNITVIESHRNGVDFSYSNYNLIDNCTIYNCTDAINIKDSHENTIRRNYIANCMTGITISYLQGKLLDRNQNILNNTFVDNAENIRYFEMTIETTVDEMPMADFSGLEVLLGFGIFGLVLFLVFRASAKSKLRK